MNSLLIVEDEEPMAQAMSRWLTSAGHQVTRVATAEEALEIAKAAPPEVAVCDISLPGRDGLWLSSQLHQRCPTTAIVLATGWDFLPAEATLSHGVTGYLLKPFSGDQLKEAVDSALAWHAEVVRNRSDEFAMEKAAQECRRALLAALGPPIVTEAEAWRAFERIFTDPMEVAHAERVVSLSRAVAVRLGVSPSTLTEIEWAARFHDLGRQTVPAGILAKPGPLSRSERRIVHRGPSEAFEILLAHPFLAGPGFLLHFIRERVDGLGYPGGLGLEDVPLGSRIVAACEALDVITTDQPHRLGRSPADAAIEMLRCGGTQFDADVVHALLEEYALHGCGVARP